MNGDHDGEEEEDVLECIRKASDRSVEDDVCQADMDTKLRRWRKEDERPGDGGYADVGAFSTCKTISSMSSTTNSY
jgi:hypothetical protein